MLNINSFFKNLFYLLVIASISIAISLINYTNKNIDYKNSDATWHALLTIEAYSQTPASVHKFLPIVTLGDKEDKNISWGFTINDKHGNYYYTSFSPAGFAVPYFFIKTFHLPINQKSLYLLNSILLLFSNILLGLFIKDVFSKSKYKYLTGILSVIFYTTGFEVMHGMGLVWWCHSIMQVTLLGQIYAYYKFNSSKFAKFIFFTLALINPYIEWTGFIANIGFIVANSLKSGFKSKQNIIFTATTLLLTILSGLLFLFHFFSVLPANEFLKISSFRADARSSMFSLTFYELFYNYITSYTSIIIFIICSLFVLMKNNIKIKENSTVLNNKILLIILTFPLIENFIMMGHAIWYTYDTMKLSYILVFICADLINIILNNFKSYIKYLTLFVSVIFLAIGNIYMYSQSDRDWVEHNFYIFDIKYLDENNTLANYIKQNYDKKNSIIGLNSSVRGYKVLLFGRNVYEYTNFDKLIDTKNTDTYIMVLDKMSVLGVAKMNSAVIYDRRKDSYKFVKVTGDKITEIPVNKEQAYVLASEPARYYPR